MKLFRYEGYKLTISEEALVLKPFRVLWNRDKTASKDRALSELAYIYFMEDPRSDYQYIIDSEERAEAIKEGEGMLPTWNPDKAVLEAMEFYKSFKPTAALLLEDTKYAIEKLRKLLRNIDLTQTDDKGRPIYTLNTITATIKQIPMLVRDLDAAEKALAAEFKEQGKIRGDKEKTILEDSLDV